MKKSGKEFSVAVWSAIALGAIGFGVIVAFVAGYFLGHFTGHETTTTIQSMSSSPDYGSANAPTASAGEGGGEAAEEEPAEAEPEGKEGSESKAAGAPSTQGSSKAAGKLNVDADPSGELKFTQAQLSTKAGKVDIDFDNGSPVPHNVAIEEAGGKVLGETKVISEGADSTEVNLKPGTYTYFCTVPGHREAGMEGTLTVK